MADHMISINPATGDEFGKYKMHSEKEVEEKIKLARSAFDVWKNKLIRDRIVIIKKVGELLRAHARKYGEIISKEMGKPIKQAIAESEKCAWACDYYAENTEKFLQPEFIETDNKKSYISFEPLGVVLGIMPWNFPFWQVIRFAVPALAAGNVCLLKHASNVPQCALELQQLFLDAGAPAGVFSALLIEGKTASSLIDKDLVDAVSLTGSVEAGSRVGENAGRTIKKVVLELGGSDPFIVLEGADVSKAAETAVTARFQNAGQSCIAAKRFIIHKAIASEFKNKFIELTRAHVVGDPLDEKTTLGPLARSDLADALEKQLNQAIKDGAKILSGGKRIKGNGAFFEPTIIECFGNEAILQEETFGPLASIIMVGGDDEALHIANSTQFGLGASVWTNDEKKIERFARELQAGFVSVNSMVKSDPRLPFGGIKKSGVGRELSHLALKEFVNVKTVIVN